MFDPKSIYQAHLDRTSQALWARDDAVISETMGVPNEMYTEDTLVVMTKMEDVLKASADFRNHLDAQGATAYHRICQEAWFTDKRKNMIVGTHLTYILRGGTLLLDPYKSEQSLLLKDGVWKGIRICSGVRNQDCTINSLEMLRQQHLFSHENTDIQKEGTK